MMFNIILFRIIFGFFDLDLEFEIIFVLLELSLKRCNTYTILLLIELFVRLRLDLVVPKFGVQGE